MDGENTAAIASIGQATSELLEIARLHQQGLRIAQARADEDRAEIRRIWEYLLTQQSNGNGDSFPGLIRDLANYYRFPSECAENSLYLSGALNCPINLSSCTFSTLDETEPPAAQLLMFHYSAWRESYQLS
jgi:hypothetical protein